ncbi:hypothetical protein ACOSP7_025605 [Xanthoceras sorbifolium]
MKLVWSPETASKAYIDTVKSCEIFNESGVAELVAAMAAGWNAGFIVETWSQGGAIATSIGLAVASRHTSGRHLCIVPDEGSRLEYVEAIGEAGFSPEVIVGDAEEAVKGLVGINFMVVDSRHKDFAGVLRLAKLSNRGAVLVCKNAYSRSASNFRWRRVVEEEGSRRLHRSVFLPVGEGLDIAHVAVGGVNYRSGKGVVSRWFKHVDQQSGELHVFRK